MRDDLELKLDREAERTRIHAVDYKRNGPAMRSFRTVLFEFEDTNELTGEGPSGLIVAIQFSNPAGGYGRDDCTAAVYVEPLAKGSVEGDLRGDWIDAVLQRALASKDP